MGFALDGWSIQSCCVYINVVSGFCLLLGVFDENEVGWWSFGFEQLGRGGGGAGPLWQLWKCRPKFLSVVLVLAPAIELTLGHLRWSWLVTNLNILSFFFPQNNWRKKVYKLDYHILFFLANARVSLITKTPWFFDITRNIFVCLFLPKKIYICLYFKLNL